MRRWSIPVLDIFGIHFRMHFSFPLMFFMIWSLESGRGPQVGFRSLLLMGLVLMAVLTHELAHALVAARNGVHVRSVVLLPIAGISLLDEKAQRGLDWPCEIRISLAGPLVNLLVAFLLGTSLLILHPQMHLFRFPFLTPFNLPRSMVWANVFVAALNLLPAYPLDGGRILRALLRAQRRPDQRYPAAQSPSGSSSASCFLCWEAWSSSPPTPIAHGSPDESLDHDGRDLPLPGRAIGRPQHDPAGGAGARCTYAM